MGLLSSLAGIAAPIVGNMIAPGIGGMIGGALGGAISGSGQPSSTTSTQSGTQNGTTTTTLNPAVAQLLGTNGGGLLASLGATMNGGSNLSGIGNSFLNANGGQILNNGYATSNALANDQYSAPTMQAAQVQAPSQNNIDLSGSYNRFINGAPGANPYLDQSIQGTIDQNRLGFQQLQDDSTKNLMQNVLPSIRSNSVLAGQYGGSRQGVAEGNAIGTQQTELARAAAQFGQNATNAAVGAKANAYETDSNRALSATQGLGAQQYGVAQQDAAARQAADIANMNSANSTNALNASKMASGMQLQQGLLSSAAGFGNADLSRLGQTAGILAPFTNAGATTTTNSTSTGTNTQPLYQNQGGNILGGALLGGQLGGLLGGSTGGSTGGTSMFNVPSSVDNVARTIGGQQLPINTSGFMNFSF